jgi:hypothetical protein
MRLANTADYSQQVGRVTIEFASKQYLAVIRTTECGKMYRKLTLNEKIIPCLWGAFCNLYSHSSLPPVGGE